MKPSEWIEKRAEESQTEFTRRTGMRLEPTQFKLEAVLAFLDSRYIDVESYENNSVIKSDSKTCPKHPDIICDLHTCPYQVDINGDSEYKCRCCSECEQQCSDDI